MSARPAKRLKTCQPIDSDRPSRSNHRLLASRSEPRGSHEDALDSEDEIECQYEKEEKTITDLEKTLPPLEEDPEAIAAYERSGPATDDVAGLATASLGDGVHHKWRSSIYVDAFNLALETVLQDESFLFNDAELAVFEHWKGLSYDAQYLYVRLFLRKTAKWHRISALSYHADIVDLPGAVKLLQKQYHIPQAAEDSDGFSTDEVPFVERLMGGLFSFADDSDISISTLDEATSLVSLDEIKRLAKDAKVEGKNKGDLLRALRRMSKVQSGLGRVGLKRYNSSRSEGITEESCDSPQPEDGGEHTPPGEIEDQSFQHENRDVHFMRKILATTGPCIRLSRSTLTLFERVHLVFYRSTEWTEKSLTTMILARISKRTFPDFIVSRSANVFASGASLFEYEAALRSLVIVENMLEFNGPPGKQEFADILATLDRVHPRWQTLIRLEHQKELQEFDHGEGAYLRRFSPAWVYTQIIHKACYVLGRLKLHDREWQMLSELLDQRLFSVSKRGAWYQRKALLEEHYMWALRSADVPGSVDQQKRHWRRVALSTCESGLQDADCHIKYHYDLQKRVRKLEKQLKLAKREQHDFGHVLLLKPVEIQVKGIKVEKQDVPSGKTTTGRGGKTIWIDEREGGGQCSVESMCLSWYRDHGWRGYHAEGGILRTLFAYLFYDVLFTYVPNVFQSPYQTCPLDLYTDAFYPSRASEINRRLVEIANGDAGRLIREVDDREREKGTCVAGLKWDFGLEDLLDIVTCFDSNALATVCKVMAQDYQQRGGGIPDLFLWRTETREVMFAEVKSENDRLSDTQRLWIHVLLGAGIRVELCHAVAREIRVV